jgi:signal transduction histidine kinase
MRERLAEFGGEIKVESSSEGSVIHAAIPTNAYTHGKASATAGNVAKRRPEH